MLVKRLQGRGAQGVVEIHGEALFAPGTELNRWKTRFQERIYAFAIQEAPTHNSAERPLRPHPGLPLKNSFLKSRPRTRITKGGGFFYAAVGNKAAYSTYVNEGTGIYAGKSPWVAKVLPPYREGSATLYEHTWRPPGGRGARVKPVFIKGQRGQFYMDTALKRAFQSMRMRSFQLPGEGVSNLALRWTIAEDPAFLGNTPADAPFVARLKTWRKWREQAFYRDEAFIRRRGAPTDRETNRNTRVLQLRALKQAQREQEKRDRRASRTSEYRKRNAERARKWRQENQKAKNTTKAKADNSSASTRTLRARLSKAVAKEQETFYKARPGFTPSGRPTPTGFWYKDRYGRRGFRQWSANTLNLFHALGLDPL